MRGRFQITYAYYVTALSRIRAGRPVSEVLHGARAVVEERGWSASSDDDCDLSSGGPVDIQTAIQIAAGVEPGPLQIMDAYAWLTPIESVVRCPVGKWERQLDLRTRDVLAVLDEAIEFALEAERSPPELLQAVSTPS